MVTSVSSECAYRGARCTDPALLAVPRAGLGDRAEDERAVGVDRSRWTLPSAGPNDGASRSSRSGVDDDARFGAASEADDADRFGGGGGTLFVAWR